MSFDGLFTHAMVNELNQELAGGRIVKIHQPYAHELVLVIRANRQNYPLLLSAHPTFARIQVTRITYQNPNVAPNFCMMMRKYLEGATLTHLEQIGNDRVIRFTFASRNELGDLQEVRLMVELMGKHSNIILLNQENNTIIDAIKHLTPSQNTYRTVLPGVQYLAPPVQEERLNPFSMNFDTLLPLIAKQWSEPELTKILQSKLQGLGRDSAAELAYRFVHESMQFPDIFKAFLTEIDAQKGWLTDDGQKSNFSPFRLLSKSSTATEQEFTSLSVLLDTFYENKAERDRVQQQGSRLIHLVDNEYRKNTSKLKKLEKTMADTEKADQYRLKGELLTTYLHQIERGMTEISLPNFYDEQNKLVKIQLSNRLTPSQNAQKYFKKYQKLKNAIIFVTEQISLTKAEINYLESVQSQIELASPKDLLEITEELEHQGYLKKQTKKKQRKMKPSQPEVYMASDGTMIYVGKNNLQNDQLTLKTAKKSDIWLHAKNIPGSHVIINSNNPSDQTLLEAARLAAYFSKSRLSATVPVDYLEVRKIRKPNGAKPGFVIYEGQQTLYVTPDADLIEKLRIK